MTDPDNNRRRVSHREDTKTTFFSEILLSITNETRHTELISIALLCSSSTLIDLVQREVVGNSHAKNAEFSHRLIGQPWRREVCLPSMVL